MDEEAALEESRKIGEACWIIGYRRGVAAMCQEAEAALGVEDGIVELRRRAVKLVDSASATPRGGR